MHRCLTVTEIQSLVFEHLQAEHLATLANLAQACTSFTETALNVLWRDLYWLAPLILVMPDDLWRVEAERKGGKGFSRTLTFTRELEESDWPRYDYYACRVRRLGYLPSESPIYPHKNVLLSLGFYRPLHSLLPNLRAFRTGLRNTHISESIPFMPALLGPSITEIGLCTKGSTCNGLPALLSSMGRLCPNLHALEVDCDSEEFYSALEKFICRLQSLRSVCIPFYSSGITPSTIRHLGSLTELQRLESIVIPIHVTSPQLRDLFATGGGRFPELRTLHFEVADFDLATDVVEALQCALKHLVVGLLGDEDDVATLSSFARFTGTFRVHRCVESLTALSILADQDVSGKWRSVRDAFRSLFSLKALKSLQLRFSGAASLNDEWLADASMAWPHLESLVILCAGYDPTMTLAGLIPLVKHCPQLASLTLALRALPFNLKLMQPGICNTTITNLTCDWFDATAPVAIFRRLVVLFPNLESISSYGDGPTPGYCREINSLLQKSIVSSEIEAEEITGPQV